MNTLADWAAWASNPTAYYIGGYASEAWESIPSSESVVDTATDSATKVGTSLVQQAGNEARKTIVTVATVAVVAPPAIWLGFKLSNAAASVVAPKITKLLGKVLSWL